MHIFISFNMKRTVLLCALKVLQQVLPFSRKPGEGVMIEMKIRHLFAADSKLGLSFILPSNLVLEAIANSSFLPRKL